jgi:transcriptional regulator with XRE-family HTH domain
MAIRDVILWAMAKRDWNPYDLERHSGVHQPTIFRILKGGVNSPQQKTLLPIAQALGLTEAQLRELQPIPGYTPGELNENPAAYGESIPTTPLTPKKAALLALLDDLTESQIDELIHLTNIMNLIIISVNTQPVGLGD